MAALAVRLLKFDRCVSPSIFAETENHSKLRAHIGAVVAMATTLNGWERVAQQRQVYKYNEYIFFAYTGIEFHNSFSSKRK